MDNPYKKARELIVRDDSVLVVIDVQQRLLEVMSEKEKTLENTVKLVKFANIIGLPVVVTEQENIGPTAEDVEKELIGVAPVMKIDFDAGEVTGFMDALKNLRRQTVVVCGIESHVCVTQTVLHLLTHYNVHVVSDAVSSRTRENREMALWRMEQAGAVMTSTEMVIFELLKKAGTEEFRQTLKMVK